MIITTENQEEFFKLVRKRWPKWSARQASGYVAGALRGREGASLQLWETVDFGVADYVTGFVFGWVDIYGFDALELLWVKALGLSEHDLDYLWWLDEK